MEPTASAEAAASTEPRSDHVTPDQKLICLASWLERTTLKEGQAAQACSVLPAGLLTIGTVFAGVFVTIDQRGIALLVFSIFVLGALALFLYYHRRLTIWRAVAVRLQKEQRLLIGSKRTEGWGQAGRHTPEQLAQLFHKQEPFRPFAGGALVLYGASVLMGVFLIAFAASNDYSWLRPAEAVERSGGDDRRQPPTF